MFLITTLIAFLYELFLAIPFIGGFTILASGYSAITVAFVIHIIVLVFRIASGRSKTVPIIAIILTCFTWIPVVGWLCHLIIAVLYLIDFIMGLFVSTNRR